MLTITHQPAVDKVIQRLRPNNPTRAAVERILGGRKGSNAARALSHLDMRTAARDITGGCSGENVPACFAVCAASTDMLHIHVEDPHHTYAMYDSGQVAISADIEP